MVTVSEKTFQQRLQRLVVSPALGWKLLVRKSMYYTCSRRWRRLFLQFKVSALRLEPYMPYNAYADLGQSVSSQQPL